MLFLALNLELQAEPFLTTGAQARLLRGRAEASAPDLAQWRRPDFDDAAWETARLPLFFGEPLVGTDLADMRGGYACVFLRRSWVVTNVAEVSELRLGAICDGGFTAWINGQEVARYNVPTGDPTFDTVANTESPEPVLFATYEIAPWSGLLAVGTNVLAVQAFSSSRVDDPDFLFDGSLEAELDDEPPTLETAIPPPGSQIRELFFIEVRFNEPVLGVEAADLLVNGQPTTNVLEVAPGDFLFSLAQPTDGPVDVSWRFEHGITDRVGTTHPFAGDGWSYQLDRTTPASGLVLSEFMADNKRTLPDEDGDSPDWIEIFNAEATAVPLAGWYLTDSKANLAQWRFPEIDLPAKGYLLVFASGKNRTNAAAKLHTNFKLANEEGYLALVDPATNVVSDFNPSYPPQWTDVSYGRAPGETRALGYFSKPTPGAAHSSSGSGFASAVEFSRPTGTFSNTFQLALATSLENAVIRYTLDGNFPTNTSLIYRAPIPITNSVQVRARTFQDGLLPGPPRSESYLLLHTNVLAFGSDLPVIILHSLGKGAPTAARLNFAQMAVLEPSNGRTTLATPPVLTTRVGIQLRGSSTAGLAKSSYKVECWDEFGADSKQAMLGLPADSDWVLYAPNQYEPVLIHNPFVHQLSRDMGSYSPRTRFVELYLNRSTGAINATHYQGIYVLEEKIKIGPDRVAIDELEPENTTLPSVTGGYLLKIDRLDPGDAGLTAGGTTMAYVDPKEREIKLVQRRAQQTYLRDYVNAFSKSLSATNWLDPLRGYRTYLDVEAAIDYHVLEVLSGNVDALVLSAYFYKPRNGRIVFGPHWDFDRALGSTDGRDANPRIWNTGPFFNAVWWTRMFGDKDFWQRWVDRWQELRETHFALTNLNRLVDQLADEVRQAQPREYQKWRIALRGGSYQSEVNSMKRWLSNRIDFIDRQLAQPPGLSHAGGPVAAGFQLTLTRPVGATVYYTLDGSDPRWSLGAVAPNALTYSGPIAIQANARVVARTRDTSKRQTGGPPSSSSTFWSRPVSATFVVASPALLITEIMFHPQAPPAGSTNTAADFEFLELLNTGTLPLSLPGFRLTNGVDYVFSANSAVTRLLPGERVLVVKNRSAFLTRCPTATNLAGEYTGSLGDGGNRLTLLGPLDEPVSDFSYRDDWARLADGFGFSLVPADEYTLPSDLTDPVRWRLSTHVGGSPGQAEPPPRVLPEVWVNEVLANTDPPEQDAIELCNPTPTPADISGWWLTDDFRAPRKYRVPENTIVPPQGYWVLTEADFAAPGPNAFALSADGDEAYLFSADAAGELTGYYHGFAFGATDPHTSLGLHQTSVAQVELVEQAEPTLGGPNRGDRIGPLVLSEIMYQPATTVTGDVGEEFIELHNISAGPVPLFNPSQPTNTWRLRGAVDLDFPTDLVLAADAYLVAVAFDPQEDLGRVAAFREQHHLKSEPIMVGPWDGRLNNAGEALRLLRPGRPSGKVADAGSIPYVLVEEVHYQPTLPWPTDAAGAGLSLARRFERSYADDPGNWFGSVPGPGIGDSDGDGLPDAWELAYGLDPYWPLGDAGATGDPDGDGVTNLQAYWTDRSPWFGPTRIECARTPGNSAELTVSYQSWPGRRYTLLSREPLPAASWQAELTFTPTAESRLVTVVLPTTHTARWYRLQVE